MLIIFLFWVVVSFFVAFVGKNKSLGYWGTFFISVLFSPVIGLLAALISGPPKQVKIPYMEDIQRAEMAENRGDYKAAVAYYKDALYRLEHLPVTNDRHKSEFRKKRANEINENILRVQRISDSID